MWVTRAELRHALAAATGPARRARDCCCRAPSRSPGRCWRRGPRSADLAGSRPSRCRRAASVDMPARRARGPRALAHRNRTAHTKVAGPTPRSRPWCRPGVLCVSRPVAAHACRLSASAGRRWVVHRRERLPCRSRDWERHARLHGTGTAPRRGFARGRLRRGRRPPPAAIGRLGACPARRLCGAGAGTRRRPSRALLLLQAALAELGAGAVASHVSAAVMHGLPTWGLPLDRAHVTFDRPSGADRGSAARPHRTPARGRRRHGPRAGRDVSGPDGRRRRAAARGSRLLSRSRMRLCARRSVIIRHVTWSTGRLRLLTAPTAQPACAMRAARPRFPRLCTPGSTPRCDARRGGRACRPHVTYWPLRTGDPKAWESRAAGWPSLVPAFPAPSCSSPSALRAASRTRTSAGPSIARSASSTEGQVRPPAAARPGSGRCGLRGEAARGRRPRARLGGRALDLDRSLGLHRHRRPDP
jgi:hypothetical protein